MIEDITSIDIAAFLVATATLITITQGVFAGQVSNVQFQTYLFLILIYLKISSQGD